MDDIVKFAVMGIAGLLVSDLAPEYLPESLDLGGFEVRRYGGAALGVYLAHVVLGKK